MAISDRTGTHSLDPQPRSEFEKMIRERIEYTPEDPQAWYYLGSFLRSHGKLEEAEEALVMSLELEALNPDALVHLAFIYDKTGRSEDAGSMWRWAHALKCGRWSQLVGDHRKMIQ
ncbi:MAG: tetratricopeptide repeat protein [Candidatus Thorarchaeota archaeon]|jgi:cytochrome c-type biogenesis protein CcmH/NrfG|nr:tetratricopeptide repeat protein [Candidatus Thorarchaeota archaeon]